MIWLYLLVGCLSFIGLAVVAMERHRGVRQGLVGPLATFLVAFAVSALAVIWLRALDHHEARLSSPPSGIELDRTEAGGEPRSEDRETQEEIVRRDPVTPLREAGFAWRAVLTADFVAGVLATAVLTLLAQIQTTITIGRLNRSIESLRRRLR